MDSENSFESETTIMKIIHNMVIQFKMNMNQVKKIL